jgi:hypothetical protein
MKTIAVVLTLAISGIAISAAYTEAYASRMNGRRSLCSDDVGCNSARAKYAIARSKGHMAKPKMGN